MKTLAAAEADFRGREGNVIVDFRIRDLSAYYETHQLRWERWDRSAPDIRGLETLTLSMFSAFPGQRYVLPSADLKAEYTMATPSKGQGARAIDLRGVVSFVEGGRVWIDLKARMERLDAQGVEFDEAVRGLFPIVK